MKTSSDELVTLTLGSLKSTTFQDAGKPVGYPAHALNITLVGVKLAIEMYYGCVVVWI